MAQNATKVAAVLQAANALLQANNTISNLEIKKALLNDPNTNWMYWDQAIVSQIMDDFHHAGKFKIVQDNGTYRTYASTTTPTTMQKPTAVATPKRGRGRPRKATTITNVTTTMSTPAPATPVVAPKRGRGRPRKTAATPALKGGFKYISRKKALELMQSNKGHFFTATFTKKEDGKDRTINCQYLKDQVTDPLGYVKVKEALNSSRKAAKIAAGAKKDDVGIRNVNLQTLKELKIAGVAYKIR